jgi:hypothetical protein
MCAESSGCMVDTVRDSDEAPESGLEEGGWKQIEAA